MAMRQKMSECGWFYHAPERRRVATEPVPVPITSQIPGLNDFPPEFDDKPREMYFKDTDTKYIRLAKQGGRKDLLQFRDFTPKRAEPKGYPRVDWFYLEDNAQEDAVNKTDLNWEFLVPEYMAHVPHKADTSDSDGVDHWAPNRAPYAFDSTTVFQREGESITDKTVKIPELRPPGYGVRSLKPIQMKKQPPRVKPLKPPSSSQIQGERPKPTGPSTKRKEDRPAMSKLLSNAYGTEWYSRQKDGSDKQDQSERRSVKRPEGTIISDYHETFSKSGSAGRPRREHHWENASQKKTTQKISHTTEEKEPFKLSRFKNVPARVYDNQ